MSASISDAPGSKAQSTSATESRETIEKQVWDQLRTCYDPEIPLNIVDLGLIYFCQVTPAPEGGHHVDVTMTLTAPGCGMGEYLKMEVQAKISTVPGVKAANVEVVFDPPWNYGLLSDAARLKLGLL
jgi:probable FeS assembly SUF system protein SufT